MDIRITRLVGWVVRGKQRLLVIDDLESAPITPEMLRKRINAKSAVQPKLSLREISRHLTSFAGKGIAECLTPDAPYGRLYHLTALGVRVKKEVLKMK